MNDQHILQPTRRHALTTERAENHVIDLEIVIADAVREGDEARAAVATTERFNAACSLTATLTTRRRTW